MDSYHYVPAKSAYVQGSEQEHQAGIETPAADLPHGLSWLSHTLRQIAWKTRRGFCEKKTGHIPSRLFLAWSPLQVWEKCPQVKPRVLEAQISEKQG